MLLKQTLIQSLIAASLVLASVLPGTLHAASSPSPLARDQEHLETLHGEMLSISKRLPILQKQSDESKRLLVETNKLQAKAKLEIAGLLKELQTVQAEHNRTLELLKNSVQIDYEARDRGAIELAASSGSISDTLSHASYRAAVSEHLDELAVQAEETATTLHQRKAQLDETLAALQELERQQQDLSEGLADQQTELNELLANRENEAEYVAKRIAKAEAVQGGLLAGVLTGSFSEGQTVRRGGVLGFEGSTGFSTGCHTHFSVIDGGRWVDPELYWDRLAYPRGDIFQPFGMTDWARRGVYGGNVHNGIDFVQGCGNAVRAAADGQIIRDTRNDGSGFGHYVMVRHRGGIITLYAHLI